MEAHELMIGNYYNWRGGDAPDEGYDEIMEAGNYAELKLYPSRYRPIPLTEQWLLDFGFEKWPWCDDCAFIPLFFGDSLYCRYYNNQWHIKRMKVIRDKGGVFGNSQGKYILPKGKIKYVHQLQNLYYALTSIHLKINK